MFDTDFLEGLFETQDRYHDLLWGGNNEQATSNANDDSQNTATFVATPKTAFA